MVKVVRSLIRYADDLIILCYSKEDAILALDELKGALSLRGLDISETKTRIVHVVDGFDFLGYTFKLKPRPYFPLYKCVSMDPDYSRVKQNLMGLYVNPSVKSIKKIKTKLKETAKGYSSNMTKIYIRKMNEIIRGYAQAKWHWHPSIAFSRLNHYIYLLNWRFASRRHRDKSKTWIKETYFTHLQLANIDSKWVFYAKYCRDNEAISEKYMYHFNWFKIRDYLMTKMDKNPDNKLDVAYFRDLKNKRIERRPFNIFFSLNYDVALSQSNLCPICNDYIFNGERIHLHHITPKSKGGTNVFSNLVLLHQYCHTQTHNPSQEEYFKNFLASYRRSHPKVKKDRK